MRALAFAAALLAPSFTYAQALPPAVEISTLSTPSEASFLAIARNGKSLATFCKDERIRQWNLPQGQLLRTIDARGHNVDAVLISDDGQRIFAAGRDGIFTTWGTPDGEVASQTKLPRHRGATNFYLVSPDTAAFSHSGRHLALSSLSDTMQVVEWPNGRSLHTLNSPPGGTVAVAFSRDDSRIAVTGTDGILRIYDSATGKLVAQNDDLLGESFAIDFSADGRQVVAGGADKTAIFVDAVSGKLVHRIGPLAAIVAYLAVSPDGKHLSTVLGREVGMMLPAPVLVWDAASGKKIAEWTPPSVALGAVWSEDGHWLVVTSTPTALHVWRVY